MNNSTIRNRVEKWLSNKGHLINKTAFEREIQVTKGVIQKHLKYNKKIKDRDIKALYRLIKKFREI